MPMKIGFINFTSFDLIKATDLVGIRQSLRPLQPGNKILSIGETHQTRSIGFSLDATAAHGAKPKHFPTDYHPLMNEYHEYFYKEAVRKDILRRIYERQQMRLHIIKEDQKQVYDQHDWVLDLITRRIYEHTGRMRDIFERVATREWLSNKKFFNAHVEERVEEKEKFPRLFKKDLDNPYRPNIKMPNQITIIEEEVNHATTHDLEKNEVFNQLDESRDRFVGLKTAMAKSKWLAKQQIFQEQRLFIMDKDRNMYAAKTIEAAQDTIDQSQLLQAILMKQK